jgi:hypothetical protein
VTSTRGLVAIESPVLVSLPPWAHGLWAGSAIPLRIAVPLVWPYLGPIHTWEYRQTETIWSKVRLTSPCFALPGHHTDTTDTRECRCLTAKRAP